MNSIPKEIYKLKKIKKLNFCNNEIYSIDNELFNLKLDELNLGRNPISKYDKQKIKKNFKKTFMNFVL